MLRSTAIGTALVIAISLAGCVVVPARRAPGPVVVVREPGPPPQAPAHGYHRHHASGVDLRFDRQLGVYVVVGYTGIYFSDDWFIRWYGGRWQFSRRVGGPWVFQPAERVPQGLRAKHHGGGPKAHGYGPAKAGW
jgi:hypothetical protein